MLAASQTGEGWKESHPLPFRATSCQQHPAALVTWPHLPGGCRGPFGTFRWTTGRGGGAGWEGGAAVGCSHPLGGADAPAARAVGTWGHVSRLTAFNFYMEFIHSANVRGAATPSGTLTRPGEIAHRQGRPAPACHWLCDRRRQAGDEVTRVFASEGQSRRDSGRHVDSGGLGGGRVAAEGFFGRFPGLLPLSPSPVVTASRAHHGARPCFLLAGQA